MPLRSRIHNTSLKLKIPAATRTSSSVTVSSPYAGGGKQSASPSRRRERGGGDGGGTPGSGGARSEQVVPQWPAVLSTTLLGSNQQQALLGTHHQSTVSAFDAAVDVRPVWEVSEQKQIRTSTQGFRDIPVRVGDCDNVDTRINCDLLPPPGPSRYIPNHTKAVQGKRSLEECYRFHSSHSEPESPILDLSPSPSDQQFRGSPLLRDIQRINQRAQHLRDWFLDLSPRIPHASGDRGRIVADRCSWRHMRNMDVGS